MPTSKAKRQNGNANLWPWTPIDLGPNNAGADLPELYAGMIRMSQEFSNLCNRRARAYMELPQVMSECQCPDDLYEAEMDFWNEAYHQYRDFSAHSLPGPLTALSGMIDGQTDHDAASERVANSAARSATKSATRSQSRRKAAPRKKSTRTTTRRRPDGNGSALYSYPEHVEGRHETRGRVH